ncbi:MAG: dethiobiotin synthase [Myxococcota bacterium]
MKGIFVTGTDTDVGKTVLSALLMAGAGPSTVYWKPVQTGLDDDAGDTLTVRRLARLSDERVLDEGPRFGPPVSPHHAAALAGQPISMETLANIAGRHDGPTRRFVVEGAGGLLVPLGPGLLTCDLVRALGLPVLVAASTRLGTINHTLLTLRHLATLGLPTLGVVLLGRPDASALTALAEHAPGVVLAQVPWLDPLDAETVAAWGRQLLQVPELQEVLS